MTTNYLDKILIFGKEYESNWLQKGTAQALLEEAYIKVNFSNETKITYILEVLDNLSKAWADKDYYLRKEATEYLLENTSFVNKIVDEGFCFISNICSLNSIKRKILIELGAIDYLEEGLDIQNSVKLLLEGIVSTNNNSYKVKAQAKGVILHINSENLFFEIIESLIAGIITKNVNIIKVSPNYYRFLYLFLQSIKEFDKSNLIYSNLAVMFWKNNDQSLEEILFNGVDKIIFNGNRQEYLIFKSKLNYNIKVVENIYGLSFSVIEGKLIKPDSFYQILNNLAQDICRWNQMSAASPHVVYVVDKDLKSSHILIESLFDEMIQFSDEIPMGNLSFDEKIEIRRVREIAKIAQIKGEGRLVCPDDFSFTLILEYNSKFKISCLNRTIYIKRVLNLDSLFEQLLPFSGRFHTAGICVSEELKPKIQRDFMNLGIKKITNIGEMTNSYLGFPVNGYYLLRELVDWISFN